MKELVDAPSDNNLRYMEFYDLIDGVGQQPCTELAACPRSVRWGKYGLTLVTGIPLEAILHNPSLHARALKLHIIHGLAEPRVSPYMRCLALGATDRWQTSNDLVDRESLRTSLRTLAGHLLQSWAGSYIDCNYPGRLMTPMPSAVTALLRKG